MMGTQMKVILKNLVQMKLLLSFQANKALNPQPSAAGTPQSGAH